MDNTCNTKQKNTYHRWTLSGVSRLGIETCSVTHNRKSHLKGFRYCVGLEGYRSQSQAYCFKTLNTLTIWLNKAFVIECIFCRLYLQVKNNQCK